MDLKHATQAASEVRAILEAKKLLARVGVVICDQGCRIDVRSESITKVRQALPLKVNGIAVIVVP